ncbi:zinc finger, CCHC-type containing protein [Tanacetum coccineum]
MGKDSVRKNSFTLSSVLSACSKIPDDGNCGEQVHANAIKLGLASKSYVQCGLVNMYGKFGLMNDAKRVFDMNESRRNRACWNAMLTSLVQNGCLVEAIKFLYQMRAAGDKKEKTSDKVLSVFGRNNGGFYVCDEDGEVLFVSGGLNANSSAQRGFNGSETESGCGCGSQNVLEDMYGSLVAGFTSIVVPVHSPSTILVWGPRATSLTRFLHGIFKYTIPPAPVAPAGQQVAPEILAAHTAWVKGSKEIELKTLFAQQVEQELLQTTRDFHSCKQEEGQSVSSYVLKIKGYIDNLERLGHPVTLGLAVSLILIGLRKEFDGFVQNYNMHSLGKTVNELHAMLKLHEQTLTLPKNNAPALHAIRAGKVQKGKKHKKPQPQMAARGQNQGNWKNKHAYAPKPKIPPPPKREDPAKDSICHECGETGHWKRNCPQYLAELLKKKKNAASGAGGSSIFAIELNTFLNRSSIYDTGCGNGQREAVEAIGVFYLCLSSGLDIVLNNCHYAPSITRGVISVSRLYDDGFINRFVNNTIQVSKNNMVYFSAIPRDDIFEIELSNSYANESSIYTVSNKRAKLDLNSALLWHCRLGHISKKRIEKLQHDGLLNSTALKAFEKCVPCMSGKMARKPYTHQVERAKDLLGLIHTDEVENQLGKTIKSLRSDRGGEYMSQEFLDHLKDHGIIAHRTPPYTPQHNGVSERRNRTLLDMVRSMMSQTTLPKSFWDYALETAARILNMVPTKKVEKNYGSN